jgi:hypothetical protein
MISCQRAAEHHDRYICWCNISMQRVHLEGVLCLAARRGVVRQRVIAEHREEHHR